MNSNLFKHIYIDNKALQTLFLFHGTGGDEHDFLFLNEELDHKYKLVGLRGNVDENGMSRFFRRLSPGVFDQENLTEEAHKLADFIQEWNTTHGMSPESTVFLGYSNGANMILALLFLFPNLIKTAVLLHPMLPLDPSDSLDLSSQRLFITSGAIDPLVSHSETQVLVQKLSERKAHVQHEEYPGGHELTSQEMRTTLNFLKSLF
jgi:predicted esterase